MNISAQAASTGPAQVAVDPPSLVPEPVPLFKRYRALRERLPHVALGQFPTPVEKLDRVGETIGLLSLWVKRDDLSGIAYGGNKVRKLEFLLGDARRAKARKVVTFGFAGSNHALATALYARELGLKSTSLLLPQANAHYVRRNLLASYHFGAELRHYASRASLSLDLIGEFLRCALKGAAFPRVIPAGGSCPLGVAGYVNAALELSTQIQAGELPEPDRIYVPLGSMGTSVGLALGLKAVGLKSQVIAVRVIEECFANARKAARLFRQTARFLHRRDASFPALHLEAGDLLIRGDCIGEGYAHFTPKAVRAAELMKAKAGITLNGTYSAKAFSAVVDDAEKQVLKGKTVLFWNTYNSRDLSALAAKIDYHTLPVEFHRYFEEEVQALDQSGWDH